MPILIVENDASVAARLADALTSHHLVSETVPTGDEVLDRLQKNLQRKPARSADRSRLRFDVIRYLNDEGQPPPPVIGMTAAGTAQLSRIERSIVRTLVFKPVDAEQLAAYVSVRRRVSRPPTGS